MKILIFIDGQNFYHSLLRFDDTLVVDYDRLASWITQAVGGPGAAFGGAHYYVGVSPGAPAPVESFLKGLEGRTGYFVRRERRVRRTGRCSVCGGEYEYTTEKRVDTRLVADLIHFAANGAYEPPPWCPAMTTSSPRWRRSTPSASKCGWPRCRPTSCRPTCGCAASVMSTCARAWRRFAPIGRAPRSAGEPEAPAAGIRSSGCPGAGAVAGARAGRAAARRGAIAARQSGLFRHAVEGPPASSSRPGARPRRAAARGGWSGRGVRNSERRRASDHCHPEPGTRRRHPAAPGE